MNEHFFTQFMLLPEELQLIVAQKLPAGDLAEFAHASKYIHAFVKMNKLWEYRLEQDFFAGKKCAPAQNAQSAQHHYQCLCSELKKDVDELIHLDGKKPDIFGLFLASASTEEGPNTAQIKQQAEELLGCLEFIKSWNQLPNEARYNCTAKAHLAYRKLMRGLSHGQLLYSKPVNTQFIKTIAGDEYPRTLKGLLQAYTDDEILQAVKEDDFELFLRLVELNERARLNEIFSRELFSPVHPYRLEALMAKGHEALSIASKSDNTELFVFLLNSYPTSDDRHDALRFSNHTLLRNSHVGSMKILLQERFYKDNPSNLNSALTFSRHQALRLSVHEGNLERINLLIQSYSSQNLFYEGLLKLNPFNTLFPDKTETFGKYIANTLFRMSMAYTSLMFIFIISLPAAIAMLLRITNIQQVGLLINSSCLGASIVSNKVFEEVFDDIVSQPMPLRNLKPIILGTPGMIFGLCFALIISVPIMFYNFSKQSIISFQEGFHALSSESKEENKRTWRQNVIGSAGYAMGIFIGGIAGLVISSFNQIKNISEHRSSEEMTIEIRHQPLQLINNQRLLISSIQETQSADPSKGDDLINQSSTISNKL